MQSKTHVKIKSSVVILGEYECPTFKHHFLYPESFALVELLDNREDRGAGIVVYVNEFMARRLQKALDEEGSEVMRDVSEMLKQSEDFHRRYVIDQCNKLGKDVSGSLPPAYVSLIHSNQWKSLLGSMGKDTFLEQIETVGENRSFKYTMATICSAVKRDQCFSLKLDGSMVPRKSGESSCGSTETLKPSAYETQQALASSCGKGPGFPLLASQALDYMDHSTPRITLSPRNNRTKLAEQSPVKTNGNVVNSASRIASASASTTPSNPLSAKRSSLRASQKQKREVPVIQFDEGDEQPSDDQENIEGGSKKRVNDTVLVYPESRASGANTCSVHYSDLKYLDRNFMLNDTIIDFYLKYIFHDLVDENRRPSIFMFNSFFYTRLSQPPTYGRPHVTPATRSKRVQSNFMMIRSWTKKVNLFEKDYIIVPINEDIHWYLAIIVNARAGIILSSNEKSPKKRVHPYVVIFDSLIDPCEPKHTLVKQLLGEYLSLEYQDKKADNKLPGIGFNKMSLEVINPKGMPQQKNISSNCGVFLLHFAEIFMRNPQRNCQKEHRSWSVKSKPKKGKKSVIVEIQPPLTRRHSTSSIVAMQKEKHFTSSLTHSRSYDSIREAMKDSPPMIISVQDLKRQKKMET
uniref:Ubiquitin-like protease family profile domain-containing protein n=1 Tax=Ditylenchus dipsaci TaxID=166011 RepID=A0A915DLS3_9BILA